MTEEPTRKLAVLLHADVIGSTALVQLNETVAHQRIQDAFQRFSQTITRHNGTTQEIRGDALVAEFSRASDAVTAALDFQSTNTAHNEGISDEIRPELRVGIAMGEVVVADNTVTGEGIVLAQRLEQLAEPGGTCVQGAAYETIPRRLPFEYENLGDQVLKGFDQPVRAFSVSLRSGEDLPAPDVESTSQSAEQNDPQTVSKLSPKSYETLIGERLELPDKPSIAVLPFQNMSGDPEQEYFADGMTEDIITTLSRVPDLIVISRNSTFVYKGRAVDVREVGRELGVAHVLEGSIRKSGNRLRITAQLVNTQSGDHTWAERYDRKLDDIFAIQDEITHNIVGELQVQLVSGESSRRATTGTKSLKAWELMIRARSLTVSHLRNNAVAAKQLIDTALELDNAYSTAWTELGWIYWEESVWGWSSEPEKSMQMAFDAAQKALSVDSLDPNTYSLLGHIYMVRGDTKQAIAMSEKAVDLAPSDSRALALLANVLIDSGRLKEGIQRMQRAIRFCPFPPASYLFILGAGFHLNGDNLTAISALEQALIRIPDSIVPRLWLATVFVEIGKIDEARAVSKEVLDIEPNFSAASWANSFKSKTHAHLKDNLIAAGLPE